MVNCRGSLISPFDGLRDFPIRNAATPSGPALLMFWQQAVVG